MKKNRTQNTFLLRFFETQKKWFVLILVGSLLGTVGALCMRQNEAIFYALYAFTKTTESGPSSWQVICDSLWIYGLQIGIMWVCGLFGWLSYIKPILLTGISMSYGFTCTCILMLFGPIGILAGLLIMGFQMGSILFLLIYIDQSSLQCGRLGQGKFMSHYVGVLGKCLVGVLVLSVMNSYIQPYLDKVVKWMTH